MENELLQRYIEGNVTTEEIVTVVNWLDADEDHVREFMALHKLYDISLLNKPAINHFVSKKKQNSSFNKAIYELIKVAAVFMITWFSLQFLSNDKVLPEIPIGYQTVFVPPGQRAEVILPDSTKVWLNAKSRIIYPTSFVKGNREVKLDGEAYFSVMHNEKQPFIVKTEKMDVCVLGTEFNVIAYSGYPITEVALLRGSVDVNAFDVSQSYIMKESEHIELKEGKLYLSQIQDMDYFKWKEGLLCFNNETVEKIIEKLQLYFDIEIVVERKELLKYHYSGKFRTKDGVEQVLKVLQLEHKFKYTRDNELNIITIK